MKVVFLDLDGVVVCLPLHREPTSTGKLVRGANREAVAQLNEIVRRTGAKVVISSTWRKHHTREQLQDLLDRAGFIGEIIGETPVIYDDLPGGGCTSVDRGREIDQWLQFASIDCATAVESHVVLDDDHDFGPVPPERWVQVQDGWTTGGLKAEHVERAVEVLNQ